MSSTLENQPIISKKDETEQQKIVKLIEEKSIKTIPEVAVIKKSHDNLSAVTIIKEPADTRASSRQSSTISSQKKSIKNRESNPSGIPLAVKAQIPAVINKMKAQTNINKSSSKPNSYLKKNIVNTTTDKHTMETQFNSNKKRLIQMQNELIEKQLPLIDLYKKLINKKKLLEKLGKSVALGEIQCVSINYDENTVKAMKLIEKLEKRNMNNNVGGSGENTENELILNIKDSMDNLSNYVTNLYSTFYNKLIKNLQTTNPELNDNLLMKEEALELKKTLESTINENEKNLLVVITGYLTIINSNNTKIEENEKMIERIKELEENNKKQEQIISDLNRTIDVNNKKFNDQKLDQEQIIGNLQNKISTLEQDLKREKMTIGDQSQKNMLNISKIRSLKDKLTELEMHKSVADSKCLEAINNLKEFKEQMRKKESQWLKEKSDKDLIIQKLADQKKQFDTRLMEFDEINSNQEKQFTMKLTITENELELVKKQFKEEENKKLEISFEKLKLENELKEMNEKNQSFNELQRKLTNSEEKIKLQQDEISKMKDSLTSYARLVAVLKVEEDTSLKQVNNLRETLKEAKNEIEEKTKALDILKEKFITKEAAYDELKNKVKKLRNTFPLANDRLFKLQDLIGGSSGNEQHHQQKTKVIETKADFQSLYEGCMTSNLSSSDECLTVTQIETLPLQIPSKIGKLNHNKSNNNCTTVDSLIKTSIRKFDCLRSRINNLNKMTLSSNEQCIKQYYLYENVDNDHFINSDNIKGQIELKTKLCRLLQKQADDCYEDLGKLIKLTISQNYQQKQQQEQIVDNLNTKLTCTKKSNIIHNSSFNDKSNTTFINTNERYNFGKL